MLRDEQINALRQYRLLGCLRSRDSVIQANQGLVGKTARAFARSGMDHDDLMQEGFVGLLKAVDSYDESLGCTFSTHATYCVRGAMLDAIRRHVRQTRDQVSLETVSRDCLAMPEPSDPLSDSEETVKALSMLDPLRARVLRLLYGLDGDPLNLAQAGRYLGLSTARVWELQRSALSRLRTLMSL